MKINTDGVLLGAWVRCDGVDSILDIGAGTGVIAVMLAQKCNAQNIVGIEIDEDSSEECAENMANSPWAETLSVKKMSIQDYARSTKKKFDLIVSNPPFFSGGTFSSSQDRNLVKHTIKLPHGDLLQVARKLITSSGRFSVILPYIEGLRFIELAEQYQLFPIRIGDVRSFSDSSIERLLITFSKKRQKLEKEDIFIRNKDLTYSDQYIALTKEYYLKM